MKIIPILGLRYPNWWEDSKILKFRIWVSKFKSNNIWPPFSKKMSNIGKNDGFRLFSARKGVKIYSIWILGPYLESFHHLEYLRPKIVMILTFGFLTYHSIFKISSARCQRDFLFFDARFVITWGNGNRKCPGSRNKKK